MLCYCKVSDVIFVSVDADRAIQQNQIPTVFSIYIFNFLMLIISTAALPFDMLSCWVNICYHRAITCFWFLIHILWSERVFFFCFFVFILNILNILDEVMPLRLGVYFCLDRLNSEDTSVWMINSYNMNIDVCICIHSQTHLHYQSPRVYWCFEWDPCTTIVFLTFALVRFTRHKVF